jgi:hypothetical protein
MSNLGTIYCSLALLVVGTGSAAAVDLSRPEMAQLAVKQMALETVECAAYFDIVSLALLHANENGTAQEYVRARKLAVDRANSLTQGIVNENYNLLIADMTKKIVLSNMTKQIDKNLSNVLVEDISVLGNKYAKMCKEVLNHPGARARFWMERVGTSQ